LHLENLKRISKLKIPKLASLIIYEDKDLLVLNKPPFLPSIDERQGLTIHLLAIARKEYPDIQICHRLDRETSGVIVFAKNPNAYRHVSMEFEHRKIEKTYHAIIDGHHDFEDVEVDLPILVAKKGPVKIDRGEGKPAQTIFHSLEFFKYHTLVECKPKTGRQHQIRIHLATKGASICADALYGGKDVYLSRYKKGYRVTKGQDESPLIQRFALHAKELKFRHPNGSVLTVEAQYPKDFSVLVALLRKYSN
jgi:RluA family pseudouridine synthase